MPITLSKLKKNLKVMNEDDLKEVIINLYQRSKDAKDILGVYFGEVEDTEIFEKLAGKLERCFRRNGVPGMFNPKLREAKKYISEYKKLFPQKGNKILELKLKYCYYLAEWLSEYGGGEMAWEDSLVNLYAECCKQVKEESLEDLYLKELQLIKKTLNRNYCELLDDDYDEYFKVKKA